MENSSGFSVKEKMQDILGIVSIGQLSLQYFGKTPSWLYHKVKGDIVNGKPAEFKQEELEQLKGSLYDLSARIRRVADTL